MRLPSWLAWYKKPEYRDIREYSRDIKSGKRSFSPDSRNKTAIPSRLKLERILENKTCSPLSLYDFYMYLKYIEYSVENLEFYVWFKEYEAKYSQPRSAWSTGERDDRSLLAPSEKTVSSTCLGDKQPGVESSEFLCDPEIGKETLDRIALVLSPAGVCASPARCGPNSKRASNYPAGLSLQGDRAELNAIIKMFLVPDAEKELNIPAAMRSQALLALQTSSDPAHLRPIADHVYGLIRNCSHRNFIRLGVSNGSYETICMVTGLGIALTIAGYLALFLRAFTPRMGEHTRWDVFAAWPMWWLGMSMILSGLRGSCFFLLLFTRRQPLPWEEIEDKASIVSQRRQGRLRKFISKLMIFDRKFRVKDVHLRQLQHKIVIQSLIGGAIFATVGVLVFIFLPIWSETIHRR